MNLKTNPEANLEANPEVSPEANHDQAGGMCSMPLEVTQEDCLVDVDVSIFNNLFKQTSFRLQ